MDKRHFGIAYDLFVGLLIYLKKKDVVLRFYDTFDFKIAKHFTLKKKIKINTLNRYVFVKFMEDLKYPKLKQLSSIFIAHCTIFTVLMFVWFVKNNLLIKKLIKMAEVLSFQIQLFQVKIN
jgi:hypothetical protein